MLQDSIALHGSNSRTPSARKQSVAAEASDADLVPTLISIAKTFRAMLGLKLAELGMHPGQDELLLALSPDEKVPVASLAATLAVRPSTVSKMLDRLETGGFVERAGDPRDRRRTVVRITSPGIEMQARLRELWLQVDNELRDVPDRSEVTYTLNELQQVLGEKLRRMR